MSRCGKEWKTKKRNVGKVGWRVERVSANGVYGGTSKAHLGRERASGHAAQVESGRHRHQSSYHSAQHRDSIYLLRWTALPPPPASPASPASPSPPPSTTTTTLLVFNAQQHAESATTTVTLTGYPIRILTNRAKLISIFSGIYTYASCIIYTSIGPFGPAIL